MLSDRTPSMRRPVTWTWRGISRSFLLAVLITSAALALGPATTYARHPTPRSPHRSSGLVAAWGFDGAIGGAGATIADMSHHGNDATLENAQLTSAGKYVGAVRFSGHDSLATVPAAPSLNLKSRMTLEAWIRPSKLVSSHATIIAKTRPGGGFPYGLELVGGRPNAYGVIGDRSVKARSKARLPRDRWSFVASTYDGSTLRLYIGNRLAAKVRIRGNFRTSAGPLQMGGNRVRGDYLTGSIDSVRIFTKARSSKQLARDARTPVRGGIIHGPASTTSGPGGTAPSGTASGGGSSPIGPVGQGASAGIGLPPPPGPAVYVSQGGVGTGDGSSCANARSAAWFNTSSSWGTGSGQIGPGDVVHLCGTIATGLRAQGSGQSGSPIAIYFEPGASISMPACPSTGCLNTNGRSYLLIDGGGTGVIQSTQNGTDLPEQVAAAGIEADGCNGCTIEYLTIQNMYVRTSQSDTSQGASDSGCMSVSGSDLTVADNTMAWAHWCVYVNESNTPTDSNVRFYGNDISNTDHGIALAFYNNSGGPGLGPFYFYGNYVHDYAAWDTGAPDTYHHDGFHSYVAGNGTPDISGGLYIYDNVWGGNVGQNDTAQVYLSGNPSITPDSPVYLFNNVVEASQSGSPRNDYFTLSEGTEYIYNNTILGNHDPCLVFNNAGGGKAILKNNLISGCYQEISNSGASNGPMAPDYNLYAAGSNNAFACNSNFYNFNQFAGWQSCIGGDSHSTTTANALVNRDGSLQPASRAVGVGANLTSACSGQATPGLGALCADIDGVPRPVVGPWNAGAF